MQQEAEGTRWLDADEQRVWRAYLEANRLLWERLDRELDERSELSASDYEIFVRLSEAEDRTLRMSQLAEQVVHSRSRLTHAVARLERAGLLTRELCPQDRRGVLCRLTDAGFAVLAQAAPVHVTGVREHLFDQMEPDEVAVLGRVMDRVRRHLREAPAR